MKQPHVILKAGAIVSAVSLVGALVAYHAGAFDSLRGDMPSMLGGSKSKTIFVPSSTDPIEPQPITISNRDAMIMSSSKSIILGDSTYTVEIGPYVPPQPPTDPKQSPPIIMGGSKSMDRPVIRVPVMPPAEPETPPSK